MTIDLASGRWINKPNCCQIGPDSVEIITEPGTDFWQRSYYGFRNDNAPALLFESDQNFTFTAHATFNYKNFQASGLSLASGKRMASISSYGFGLSVACRRLSFLVLLLSVFYLPLSDEK